MTTATRSQFQKAIDKAQDRGTVRTVRQLGNGRYAVPGADGTRYVVTVAGGEYACTCTAGAAGMACYHQAAVWLKRLGEQAGGQQAAPAAVRESDAQARERLNRASWTPREELPLSAEEYAAIYGRRAMA